LPKEFAHDLRRCIFPAKPLLRMGFPSIAPDMIRKCLLATLLFATPLARAQDGPPRDNPYDVISKVFTPFWGVLLAANNSPNKACTMTIVMTEVTGRLPKQMEGATLKAAVEFPDKVRLQAPVLGEEVTVCRNGDEVWATPGAKVEFLLKQFDVKPPPTRKTKTPIYLPITPQQAFFLPALFTIINAEQAEITQLNGEDVRVITAGLMPELAKAAKAEGFRAKMFVGAGFVPKRFVITQPDFTATVDIRDLRFGPSLKPVMWDVPAGVTDIYRTNSGMLDAVLFVVMNSLKMTESDRPWDAAKDKKKKVQPLIPALPGAP